MAMFMGVALMQGSSAGRVAGAGASAPTFFGAVLLTIAALLAAGALAGLAAEGAVAG